MLEVMNCPKCQLPMQMQVLRCAPCGLEIRGDFVLNEFARLSGDDLHLLRIFIFSEGRVRDMEAALGLSYPTIRTRLSELKHKLFGEVDTAVSEEMAILQDLERGKIDFEKAMAEIKKLKGGSK